jgi:phthalate 4,5-dioxygenase oxygenase subunit
VFVAPATAPIPPNNKYNVANINVRATTRAPAFYFIAWGHPHNTPDTEAWRKFLGQRVGVDLDEDTGRCAASKHFWQDRNAMKAGNFTGITGFPNQDIAMWVTMGPIADRTHDRLGASDLASSSSASRWSRRARLRDGKPRSARRLAVPAKVCSFQAIVPKTVDWQAYDVKPVWETPGPVLEPSYDV